MNLNNYDLPDIALIERVPVSYRFMVWEPGFLCIVLGQSNKPERSVYMEKARTDGVPVYKRPSGGETVVLSPKTLCISVVQPETRLKSPKLYFKAYNEKIIRALRRLGIGGVRADGISDICIGQKKILGSSIFRDKSRVMYHAVLNRAESVDTIAYYLKHPPREPEYRNGRSHSDFVTSLENEGYVFPLTDLKEALMTELRLPPLV